MGEDLDVNKMALIEFEHIVKRYPGSDTAAIEDLNLGIEAGEFLTLLGPSGSGKTTTLMLLAGFEAPTSGQIRLDSKPIQNLPPHQRNMGVVFQSYSLFPHMTVAENVAFPLTVRKVPAADIDRRVKEALGKVQLQAYAQRKPVQLSGGQQQRVALARALVFEPRLVLMDEPLSALDKKLREEMQLEIRRLHRDLGVTMVFVTHDQAEAMTLSDRIAVFNQGRITQLGTPSHLYRNPANPFVAGFLGDNNLLHGVQAGGPATAGEVALQTASGQVLRAQPGPAAGNSANTTNKTLCVRPEFLQLDGADASKGDADNHLPAVLSDMIHQGDHWRLLLTLKDVQNADGSAMQWLAKVGVTALPSSLAIGQSVSIRFSPADAWIF